MENVIETRQCRKCQAIFEITDCDQEFFDLFQVSRPTLCPECRQRNRLVYLNQLNLFQRTCDKTGEKIVSFYPPDAPVKVYSQKYWYSDEFDATEYGRDFDFSRPFFEQFKELADAVPRFALFTMFLRDENSAYTNCAGLNKNCYLIFDSDENWDCYYSYGMNGSKNSSDCYRVQSLELCYEAVDSKNCYNCAYIYNSENCVDSMFLNNCIGVKNSIFCSNLRQKEYHIFNKPVSKEEYEDFKAKMKSYAFVSEKLKEFEQFKLQFPQKFMRGFQNENVSGNYLVGCKDVQVSFDSMNFWNGKYCTQMFMTSKDCYDCDENGDCELMYGCENMAYQLYNCRFCLLCQDNCSNITYCQFCVRTKDSFGCIGLKGKRYCILNKQYTKEEYEELVPRIIEHMNRTASARSEVIKQVYSDPAKSGEREGEAQSGFAGLRGRCEPLQTEWSEFFPPEHSPFPYNLTMAQEHLPLMKDEALMRGFGWKEYDSVVSGDWQVISDVPDNIDQVDDKIVGQALACGDCGRAFKIVTQELEFYRLKGLPLPRKCFYCRNRARFSTRTKRVLYDRNCDKCRVALKTAFAPEQPEKVYCEKCYLESLS